MIDREQARLAQVNYCKENKYPEFAPTGDGKCYRCNRNIFEIITVEEASTTLITGCPYCHRSYVD